MSRKCSYCESERRIEPIVNAQCGYKLYYTCGGYKEVTMSFNGRKTRNNITECKFYKLAESRVDKIDKILS